MRSIQEPSLSADEIKNYLAIHYPEHADSLSMPPFWIQELAEAHWKDETEHGEWQIAGEKRKSDGPKQSIYEFWKGCIDIQYITPQVITPGDPPQVLPKIQEFFFELGFGTALPAVPQSSRPIGTLLDVSAIWTMSSKERTALATKWEEDMRLLAYTTNLEEYERLRSLYRDACKEYNDIRDEVHAVLSISFVPEVTDMPLQSRRRLLSGVDIIGCTTTGTLFSTRLSMSH